MDNMFYLLAFLGGSLLAVGLSMVIVDIARTNHERIQNRLAREEETRLLGPQRVRAAPSFQQLHGISDADKELLRANAAPRPTPGEWLAAAVEQAGMTVRPAQLAFYSAALALAFVLPLGLLWQRWALGAILGALAAPLPLAHVLWKRRQRMERLLAQLPDAFELMSRTMRAGQTVAQAFQAVADEFASPIAEEFRRCFDQQNLGLAPDDSLRSLAQRTGLLELKIFVLAVMVHRQTGGNLTETVESLAGVIRDRYRVRGIIRAATAEGRMEALVLLALPFLLFGAIYMINRPYMMILFEYPMFLGGMGVSMIIGAFWIRVIVTPDF